MNASRSPPAPVARVGSPPFDRDQALVREANQHYERSQQLLRQGDWAGYGQETKKLGDVLKRLPSVPPR